MDTPYHFGRFELNATTRQLLAEGKAVPLGARAFDVLLALIERRDRLVTKNELLELAWPGLVVEENNLQVQISALRKLLGPQSITTIPGRGYRFTCSLDRDVASEREISAASGSDAPGTIAGSTESRRTESDLTARSEPAAPPGETAPEAAIDEAQVQASLLGLPSSHSGVQPVAIWQATPNGAIGANAVHPSTPRSQAKRWLLPAVSAVLVLSVLAGGWLWWRGDASQSLPGGRADTALADSKSIAVLPFTNLSEDKNNAYFADGMQEELLTHLALLGELKVVSRTSVMEYRASKKHARQIGSELGVRSLVEGSVRREGNRVRVTAQLIDANADKTLWAKSYDRELKDVFAIQSELATEIARSLRVSLNTQDQARLARRPTENLAAYDLLLRHQEMINQVQGTGPGRALSTLKERIALLTQAVELDPKFALAWARLGTEHARAHQFHDMSLSRLEHAKDAMARALALAPDDIDVQIEQGSFHTAVTGDLGRAARVFEKVLQIAPNNVEALVPLAIIRRRELRRAEEVALLERALIIDPRNVRALGPLGVTLLQLRRYDRALAIRQRLIDIRPGDVDLQANYHEILYARSGSWDAYDKWRLTLPPEIERTSERVWWGDLARATARRDFDARLRLLESPPKSMLQSDSRRIVLDDNRTEHYLVWGDRPRARALARQNLAEITDKLRRRPNDVFLHVHAAIRHAYLGEREAALAEHHRAHALALAANEPMAAINVHRQLAGLYALLGDRERALQKLSQDFRLPGSFPHNTRLNPWFFSLWDDPAFQAIVNDPANNAPIPFDVKYPDGRGS